MVTVFHNSLLSVSLFSARSRLLLLLSCSSICFFAIVCVRVYVCVRILIVLSTKLDCRHNWLASTASFETIRF